LYILSECSEVLVCVCVCVHARTDTPAPVPMYDAYQTWASKTYGDSAKTKTVTRKKYDRIVKILRGEESSSVENSKFRFWVKAKGFKLAPLRLEDAGKYGYKNEREVLYVPSTKTPVSSAYITPKH
jgi:hypothetical protein